MIDSIDTDPAAQTCYRLLQRIEGLESELAQLSRTHAATVQMIEALLYLWTRDSNMPPYDEQTEQYVYLHLKAVHTMEVEYSDHDRLVMVRRVIDRLATLDAAKGNHS